jgi:uncharacterized membrane protein (DUF4010 family)
VSAASGGELSWLFGDLAIALFIGAMVGAERERRSNGGQEPRIGVRSFALLSLAGATFAQLAVTTGGPLFEVALVATAVVVLGARVLLGRQAERGVTTEIAALFVFGLGGVVVHEGRELAVALGVVTAGLLALKAPLHRAVQSVGETDVYAVLQLLFATFIVLPVLPREAIDPWGALRPYALWWLVILISGLSLVGYVGGRLYGAGRGALLEGLFGGLVSSTAVTLEFARRSRSVETVSAALVAGILVAWSTMAGRVLVEVAVVAPGVLPTLIPALVAFFVPAIAAGLMAWRRVEPSEEAVAVSNPFRLWAAATVALVFAVVLLGVKAAQLYLPASGLYVVAALAGGTDVDAITLSLAQESANGALAPEIAADAIVLAVASNTVVKWGLALWLGDRTVRLVSSAAAATMLVGAGFAVWLT